MNMLTEKEIKKLLKECVQGLIEFDWNNNKFQEKIREMYNIFLTMPIEDISYIKNLGTPKKTQGFLTLEKGAGAHVKAAEFYNQIIKELHIENVFVLPNMITIQPPKTIDYSIKRVIAVGRYSDQKGFDMLIKAWGKLSPKYHDWHLYIFGNEDRVPYEEMAKTEKCQDTCHCMPVTEDIATEYGKSSIFVMSSRYEGMPLALIEAMSSGLACVSFNCPNGPSDIINDGTDGFLAKNGDIDDLAAKIENLICKESLRSQIGIKAKQNIERYSPDAIMQQNILLYNRILNL